MKSRKFETLDALRGIAALSVVTFHFASIYGGPHLFPHGYLAVDFFFGLSGFIVSHAYQGSLDQGKPTGQFLITRLMRLYPMYLLGLALGFAAILRARSDFSFPVTGPQLSAFLLLGLAFLPAPPGSSTFWHIAFPFDMPVWSLFSELVANMAHAVTLRRRTNRTLWLALLAAGVALACASWRMGTLNLGANQDETWFGLLRVAFSYLAGMLVYRVWSGRTWPAVTSISSAGLLCLLLIVPVRPMWEPAYDLFAVVCAFPAVVLLGARAEPHPRWRRGSTLLGQTSYGIYVLHVPLLFFFGALWRRMTHRTLAMTPLAGQLVFLALVTGVATLLNEWYDEPVRAKLRARLAGRTTALDAGRRRGTAP